MKKLSGLLTLRNIKEIAVISLGTAIAAAAVYFFMLPSNLAVGSASALAMVISEFVPLPVSAITFLLNAVLLIIGFLLIGPEFGAKTIYTSILLPAVMRVYEVAFPNVQSITGDPFQDMVCYILLVGVGLALKLPLPVTLFFWTFAYSTITLITVLSSTSKP